MSIKNKGNVKFYQTSSFNKEFKFEKEIELQNFGIQKLYKSLLQLDFYLISFEYIVSGKNELDEVLDDLLKFNEKFKNESIVPCYGILSESLGSVNWRVTAFYQFYLDNLRTECEARIIKLQHFSEGFLWNILEKMTLALLTINEQGLTYNSFNYENIMLDKQMNPFILFNSDILSNSRLILKGKIEAKDCIISLEEVKAIEEGKSLSELNLEKSDIYCLGIMTLMLANHLTLFEENPEDSILKSIDDQDENKIGLAYLSLHYKAEDLRTTIAMMICTDPSERYSLDNLIMCFEYLKRTSINSRQLENSENNRLSEIQGRDVFDKGSVSSEKINSESGNSKGDSIRYENLERIPLNNYNSQYNHKPTFSLRSANSSEKEIFDLSSKRFDNFLLYGSNRLTLHEKNEGLHEFAPYVVKQSIQGKKVASYGSPTDFSTLDKQLFDSLQSSKQSSKEFELRLDSDFQRKVSSDQKMKIRQSSASSFSKQRVTFGEVNPRSDISFRVSKKLRKTPSDLIFKILNDVLGNPLPDLQTLHYDDESVYKGQVKNGIKHGKGHIIYSDGSSYIGEWENDEITGFGYQFFANGDFYEGYLHCNDREGFGIYISSQNDKYEGNWEKNKYKGWGSYFFAPHNETFIGNFLDGLKHGEGTYTYSSGDVFKGFWVKDKKMGDGSVAFVDGCVFEGTWFNDFPNGDGIMHYANGDKYIGSFNDGRKDGNGVYEYSSGEVFEGDWKDDGQKQGVYKYNEHERYNGSLDLGTREGYGEYNYSTGEKYTGEWKNNKRNGRGKLLFKGSQGYYEGSWKDNQYHGDGLIKFINGDIYSGNFKEGKKDGIGEFVWADGSSYSGHWSDNEMDGSGVYKDSNGVKFDGIWEKGRFGH